LADIGRDAIGGFPAMGASQIADAELMVESPAIRLDCANQYRSGAQSRERSWGIQVLLT
jgi:hypothetical protein